MNSISVGLYVMVNLALAGFDIFLAFACLKYDKKSSRIFSCSLIAATITVVSYICSIFIRDYFWYSLFSSIYFISIDWCLAFFLYFTCVFLKIDENKVLKLIIRLIFAYAAIDTITNLINPFYEISISYIYRQTAVSCYAYDKMFLYNVHLIMSYVIIGLITVLYVHKSISVPREYANRFLLIVLGLFVIVMMNGVFLFIPGNNIFAYMDISITGYSILGYFIYYSAYRYISESLLRDLSKRIFERSNQGSIFFDYNNELVMANDVARDMLKEIEFKDGMSAAEFTELCNMPEAVLDRQDYTFQHRISADRSRVVRCNHIILEDDRNQKLGHMFFFTDETNESDPVSGFIYYSYFKKNIAAERLEPKLFKKGMIVLEIDITNLGVINTSYGKEAGDKKIIELSDLMIEYLPKDTLFIRGIEANLIAIVNMDKKNTETALRNIRKHFSSSFNNVILEFDDNYKSIFEVIDLCSETLNIKKLLDMSSRHSNVLVSLVRALQECDSDTKSHVERTQLMGSGMAKRLGLNEYEEACLSLLCLLHDIGKIGVPLEILNKPGKLTAEEFAVIRTHVEKGYQITQSNKEFRCISDMVLHHHERWDGTGYPSGLAKEDIPLLSRIISVVDSYDAMVSTRSYRKGRSSEQALEELRRCSGTQFDPKITEEFINMISTDFDFRTIEFPSSNPFEKIEQNKTADINRIIASTKLVNYSRYILDPRNYIITVDYNFETITGYTMEDVGRLHLNQIDLVPEKDRDDYLLLVNEALARHQMAFTSHNLLRKDGTTIKVLCIGKIYYDSVNKEERSEIFICEFNEN
ncbi:MAG: HD domain-containing protein [Erysipelotrichaceae bacterium]|nr:HD domain-containing protein [Erysipelotrichaceae bacterium]